MSHPCPFHLLLAHRAFLVTISDQLDPGMPIFPTMQKQMISKDVTVKCIVDVAGKLGLSILDADNAKRFGGHFFRVTGARWLAELGLPLVSVQLLVRWEGNVIRRYIVETPFRRLSEDKILAAGDHHMRSLLSHSDHKLAGLRSTLPKVTEELWTELRSQRQLSETLAVVMATPHAQHRQHSCLGRCQGRVSRGCRWNIEPLRQPSRRQDNLGHRVSTLWSVISGFFLNHGIERDVCHFHRVHPWRGPHRRANKDRLLLKL